MLDHAAAAVSRSALRPRLSVRDRPCYTVGVAATSLHLAQPVRCSAAAAYAFASDPANLPSWAAGLGGTPTQVDGPRWRMSTPDGAVELLWTPANDLGVLDHTLVLPDGTASYNPVRVLADGDDACEVVFTLRRRPGMTDEDLEQDAAAVVQDLRTLARVLESGLPQA
jgi:hypothetical protein